MATRKPKSRAPKSANKVSLAKVRNIWKALSADTWMEILQKYRGNHNWYEKGRGDIWGSCVNHAEDTASFHVMPDRGYAHCFGCHYHVIDPVELVSKVLRQSYSEAFAYIINQYGPIQGFNARAVADAERYAELQATKRTVLELLNAELVDAATSMMSGEMEPKYRYAEKCLNYLKSRAVPLDVLHTLPLMLVCPPGNLYDRLKQYERQTQRKGKDIQDYLEEVIPKGSGGSSPFEGWLMFANHVSPSTLGTFRLREPSFDGSKNLFALSDGNVDTPVGYFGLGTSIFTPIMGLETPQSKSVTVVEGEFDALAAIIPQVTSGDVSSVVIASGGNSNVCLDDLAACGFETVNYVPDWDGAGDVTLASKLKATKALRFKIFNPPDLFRQAGKDLHDVYMVSGGDTLLGDLLFEQNYLYPHQWAIQRTVDECADIPDGDIRTKTQTAHTYIKLLNDQSEKDAFVSSIAKAIGIGEDSLRRYATPDTDEGFIELAANFLSGVYEFLYQEDTTFGKRIVAWNKATKTQVGFDMSRANAVLSVLKVDLGSVVDWIEENVGVPPECQPVLTEDAGIIEKPREKKHKYYSECLLNDVFPRLLQRKVLRQKSEMTSIGQGIHVPDAKRIYVVNGNLVFKGFVNEDDTINWSELDLPQDDEFLFDLDVRKRWSTRIGSVDDICTDAPRSLGDLLDAAYSVFDTGFRFLNHELECKYLATFLLTAPVVDLFDHVPWIFVNGPTSSGKSSLNAVLASQDAAKRTVNLFEHSLALDNATPAGVKQSMRGTTLTLALDEFEVGPETSYETKHTRCREILELVRGAMGSGSKISMGTAGGTPIYWSLRFPFIASGIYTFHKQEDANRFNVIEMAINDPNVGKIKASSPKYLILNKFKVEDLKRIREDITVSLLRNIPIIRKAYNEIKIEYSSGQNTDPSTHARFREQLLPIIALLKAAGKDYKNFSLHYTKAKARRASETAYANKYEDIWQHILHTGGLIIPGEEGNRQSYTLAQLLNDPHKRGYVNLINSGVYYLPEEHMIAVVWTTALGGPLLKYSKYATYGGPEKIRNVMLQDPHVINDKDRDKYRKLLPRLTAFVGRVRWKDVTFIRANEFIVANDMGMQDQDDLLAQPQTNLKTLKSIDLDEVPVTGEDNI